MDGFCYLHENFSIFYIEHIPKAQNEEVNRLAHSASSYLQVIDIFNVEIIAHDWRREIWGPPLQHCQAS